MKEKEQVELIERYITGQLDIQERCEFEKQLQSDPVLARKTSSYRDSFIDHISASKYKIKSGIIAVGKRSSSISRSVKELNQKKNLVKAIGIFLIVIICLASVYFILDKSPDYSALYNKYYNESLLDHPLLKDAGATETYGITHYQNRDFSRAIPALEKEITASPTDARLYLYLGLSYLESDVDDKAKINFEKAESLSDGKYRDSAIWYLALTEIKLNHVQEAKNNLLALVHADTLNPYKGKAQSLLDKLN